MQRGRAVATESLAGPTQQCGLDHGDNRELQKGWMGNQGQRASALDQGSGSGDGGKVGSDVNITLEVKSTGSGAAERQKGLLTALCQAPLGALYGLGTQHWEWSHGPVTLRPWAAVSLYPHFLTVKWALLNWRLVGSTHQALFLGLSASLPTCTSSPQPPLEPKNWLQTHEAVWSGCSTLPGALPQLLDCNHPPEHP